MQWHDCEVLGKEGFGPVEEGMEGKGRSWGEPWVFPARAKGCKGPDSRRGGGEDPRPRCRAARAGLTRTQTATVWAERPWRVTHAPSASVTSLI